MEAAELISSSDQVGPASAINCATDLRRSVSSRCWYCCASVCNRFGSASLTEAFRWDGEFLRICRTRSIMGLVYCIGLTWIYDGVDQTPRSCGGCLSSRRSLAHLHLCWQCVDYHAIITPMLKTAGLKRYTAVFSPIFCVFLHLCRCAAFPAYVFVHENGTTMPRVGFSSAVLPVPMVIRLNALHRAKRCKRLKL